MYYLKTKKFKNIEISYGRDDYDPMCFAAFKHKDSPFFERFSKVIDFTIFGRRLVLEF